MANLKAKVKYSVVEPKMSQKGSQYYQIESGGYRYTIHDKNVMMEVSKYINQDVWITYTQAEGSDWKNIKGVSVEEPDAVKEEVVVNEPVQSSPTLSREQNSDVMSCKDLFIEMWKIGSQSVDNAELILLANKVTGVINQMRQSIQDREKLK